ncbi:unnamed protein product, partial [Adineta steineri]
SHENFETLLKQLEHRHSDRLKSTEDKQQTKIILTIDSIDFHLFSFA